MMVNKILFLLTLESALGADFIIFACHNQGFMKIMLKKICKKKTTENKKKMYTHAIQIPIMPAMAFNNVHKMISKAL